MSLAIRNDITWRIRLNHVNDDVCLIDGSHIHGFKQNIKFSPSVTDGSEKVQPMRIGTVRTLVESPALEKGILIESRSGRDHRDSYRPFV